MNVDGEETVLTLVKSLNFLVSRGFGQFAIQSIGPAMIPAGEDFRCSAVLFHYRVGTVSANVVKRMNISAAVTRDNEVEASDVVADPVTGFLDPRLVCGHKPSFGEDGSSL